MASIQSDINELNSIEKELKRLGEISRKLRKQKKDVEDRIIQYLKFKNQPGVKFGGNALVLEEKTRKVSRKKKEYENVSLRILRENGVNNAEEVFNELLKAKIHNESSISKLKMKKLK